MPPTLASNKLTLEPIGYIRTTASKRYQAPHQPGGSGSSLTGRVVLNAGHNFEQALEDLTGFDKLWLIYWFDRNPNWKPKVQVPRGPAVKRGVFATRSPHRPNPIGLSLVDLIEIKGRNVFVGNVDLLDKTPILDIKPYLPYAEAHPNAKAGWLDSIEQDVDWAIEWADLDLSTAQKQELEAQLRLSLPIEFILDPAGYPLPHPYKRIKRLDDERYELAIQDKRICFSVQDRSVTVLSVR